jgi:hypothetical protein
MKDCLALATMLAAVCLVCLTVEARAEARLDWVFKAYGDGKHNAFTDLIRWNGQYYLCFRHGASHLSMDGEIRVMRSADMKTWEPCRTLDTWGDDRDPHFVATDDTLYVYFGTWDLVHARDPGTPDRGSVRSHFASTTDGLRWSKVQGVYEPGWWLWRVRRHDRAFYSAAYTAVRPVPPARETRLLRSDDGLNWTLVSTVTKEGMSGEADLWFDPDGSIELISRTNDAAGIAMWFRSDPARTQWQGRPIGLRIHSPVFAAWKDRRFIGGRHYQKGDSVTRIWEQVSDQIVELITLPSGGDTGYPGLIMDPASAESSTPALFVSWYSQHEREPERPDAASIYVARVSITP